MGLRAHGLLWRGANSRSRRKGTPPSAQAKEEAGMHRLQLAFCFFTRVVITPMRMHYHSHGCQAFINMNKYRESEVYVGWTTRVQRLAWDPA